MMQIFLSHHLILDYLATFATFYEYHLSCMIHRIHTYTDETITRNLFKIRNIYLKATTLLAREIRAILRIHIKPNLETIFAISSRYKCIFSSPLILASRRFNFIINEQPEYITVTANTNNTIWLQYSRVWNNNLHASNRLGPFLSRRCRAKISKFQCQTRTIATCCIPNKSCRETGPQEGLGHTRVPQRHKDKTPPTAVFLQPIAA